MPCRNDGYGDPLADVASARDKAAAVACECIKAMLLNDGYDLHDLPTGAEAWFREHRERDKAEAIRLAEIKLQEVKREPKPLVEDKQLRARGYYPNRDNEAELSTLRSDWIAAINETTAFLQKLKMSNPMDLKHGLY